MKREAKRIAPGPFKVEHLKPGDRYELSEGHAYYCAPTSGDGASSTVAGGQVLDSDPEVESSGFDAGFTQGPGTLWAPDIAVGNVPDRPGWIAGAPLLGVEYAGVGQDEEKLLRKIADLFAAGTRWIWVVRLVGPRRVEVHSPGEPVRSVGPGEELTAPGVLRNPVPVEALYDRATAHEVTLRNLLQRRGYNGLEEVREEGREEGLEAGREEGREEGLEAGREEGREEGLEAGREEGLEAGREEGRRQILAQQIRHRFGELSEAHSARLASAGVETLGLWAERILTASSMEDLFGTE